MKKRLLLILLLALLVITLLVYQHGQASRSLTITVTGADAVFQPDLATGGGFNTTLRSLINGLSNMLPQVRSPDATFWTEISPVSSHPTFEALLDSLPMTLPQVRSPDATFWVTINSVYNQPTLAALLANLPPYYIPLRSADAALETKPFAYPAALIRDTVPPIITNVQVEPITGLVQWDTDEFANSEARFGSTFGVYPIMVSDGTWVISHQLLPNAGGGAYIKIRSVDRSGNAAEYYYPGFSISGHIKDTHNVPIPGVVVKVSNALVAVTDENGDYAIHGVPSGSYTLTAAHDQYHFTPASIPLTVSGDLTGENFTGETTIRSIFLPLLIK
jgi:hypothetical protein